MDSGFRRREIASNEVRLSFLENDGDGPVVVALHGLAGAGDAFTADVAAVIRVVSPGRPVTLVGQSMGGHTAILAAAAFPDLVARLVVLEATVAGGVDPARIGDYFSSWPTPFASAAEAEAFLGQDALSRSWIGHLEPSGAAASPRRSTPM